jgi:hypothetical protein
MPVGFINVFWDWKEKGTVVTGKLCPSRLVADNAARSSQMWGKNEKRIAVWKVEYDHGGTNPRITVQDPAVIRLPYFDLDDMNCSGCEEAAQ